MNGLSADKLRVLLQPVKEEKIQIQAQDRMDDEKEPETEREATSAVSKQDFEGSFRENQVLATLQDGTRGLWKAAQVMYSFPLKHRVSSY